MCPLYVSAMTWRCRFATGLDTDECHTGLSCCIMSVEGVKLMSLVLLPEDCLVRETHKPLMPDVHGIYRQIMAGELPSSTVRLTTTDTMAC